MLPFLEASQCQANADMGCLIGRVIRRYPVRIRRMPGLSLEADKKVPFAGGHLRNHIRDARVLKYFDFALK